MKYNPRIECLDEMVDNDRMGSTCVFYRPELQHHGDLWPRSCVWVGSRYTGRKSDAMSQGRAARMQSDRQLHAPGMRQTP